MEQYIDFATIPIQFITITAATILCSLLGIERHIHQKNAGIKTHALVGMGSCIFTLVSAYGFGPVLASDVHLDPSRIAAQIVSGIGFLGAGVIFVNNDTVRGLTTAATIWLSAAIGMACGASMLPLAAFALLLHYALVFVLGPLLNKLPHKDHNKRIVVEYATKQGIMPQIMMKATALGFKIMVDSTTKIKTDEGSGTRVVMYCDGSSHRNHLVEALSSIPGVYSVDVVDRASLE